MRNYENLANAIIIQAVTDYRKIIGQCRKYNQNWKQNGEIQTLNKFFRSQWFITLTSIDGERLISMLNKEAESYDG
ncbi:MAG: hypothetical protein LIO87_00535 [Eubacterium sp.]|nr:hypothetical protein [Eubacterium sp.]